MEITFSERAQQEFEQLSEADRKAIDELIVRFNNDILHWTKDCKVWSARAGNMSVDVSYDTDNGVVTSIQIDAIRPYSVSENFISGCFKFVLWSALIIGLGILLLFGTCLLTFRH